MRSRRTITLVMSLVLLLVVAVGYFAYANNLIPFLRTSAGTIASSDGSVELHIPDGAQTPGTHIIFTPDPLAAQSLNLTARGVSALGSPVNIAVTNGTLAPNRVLVTMKYNPLTLPKGVTLTNLGMAVFDPNFDAWMPLGSTVDPQTHTVSAIAPHFSLFSVIFLDPAKRIVHVGGIVISTVINGTITIAKWFGDLLKQLIVATIKDLFGIAPTLTCSPVSSDLVVEARSILNRLTSCVQPTSKGDESLRMRNGYGFPLRINTFPSGYTQSWNDISTNGGDILNLVRNGYYHFLRQAVLPGADLGSLTVKSTRQGTSQLGLNLDAMSIGEDVVLTALLVFVPVGKVADAYGEKGIASALQEVVRIGVNKGGDGPFQWLQRAFDGLDCVNTSAHYIAGLIPPFKKENLDSIVDIGRKCVSSVMDKFNLESVLEAILGSLKIVPEIVEAAVAEALNKGLPLGFNPNTTSYTVTVTRLTPSMVTTYEVPNGDVLHDITTGPDGNLWFTASRVTNSGRVGWIGRITPDGQVTPFPLPGSVANLDPGAITNGPDGNLWFVLSGDTSLFAPPGQGPVIPGQIGRITTGGVVQVFPAATATSNPVFLTAGPDGNVWFTDTDRSIGRITPGGQITEFPVSNTTLPYGGIAVGSDGNIWFAAIGAIGRITLNGKVTLFTGTGDVCPNVSTCDLVTGPDGNLWFTDGGNGYIGRITLNGNITRFPTNSSPLEITVGPDSNLWFTNGSGGSIGRITPDGSITFPAPNAQGLGITVGPDGNLWFTGGTPNHGIIMRMTL